MMEGTKNFTYILTPSAEEVSLLVCELTELFRSNNELVNTIPTVFKLSAKLAQLKGRQDYNPESAANYQQKIRAAISPSPAAEASPAQVEAAPVVEGKKPRAPKKSKSKSEARRLEVMKKD